jgi:hypothetical protein
MTLFIMYVWKTQIRNTFRYICGLSLLLAMAATPTVQAAACSTNPSQQSCSGDYGVNEVFFGTGGQYACSGGTYCANETTGDTAVGNTKGTAYQAQGGFNTNRSPSLSVTVSNNTINLGVLTAGTTATATSNFSVESYLSSGYIVQIVGNPPTNSTHQLTALTSPTASNSSAEQFGLNLVANTSPVSFGANPSQSPDSTFGFGTAASGYNTANLYQYASGNTVAQSLKSSGITNYTVSYIFNTTVLTPGGTYTTNQAIVATATF